MIELTDKKALITGGSRGIGRAISLAMGKAGAQVVLTYQKEEEKAKKVVSAIQNRGGDAIAVQMTVENRESVQSAISMAVKHYGGLDILVNNAGINKPTDFDQITDMDWDEIMAVNLKGPFICSQEILPAMRKAGGGSIINIGSVSGQYGGPRTAHYAAGKAGLISLGQVVARFGAKDNIRCNTIAAGLVATEMAEAGMQSEAVKKASENILLNRFATTDEIASSVLFLASDASSYITAQTLNVNGGLYF